MNIHGESSISSHQFQFADQLAHCKVVASLMKKWTLAIAYSTFNTLSLHDTFL